MNNTQVESKLCKLFLGSCTLWQSRCSRPLDTSETYAETQVHRLLHLQVHPGRGQIPLGRPQLRGGQVHNTCLLLVNTPNTRLSLVREEEELVVSTPYIEHWNDLIDLWYLGMQVCLKSCAILSKCTCAPGLQGKTRFIAYSMSVL